MPTRIARKRTQIVQYDEVAVQATPSQLEMIPLLKGQVDKATLWMEEDGSLGVQTLDDGMTLTGYFGRDGELIGDWS